MSRIVYVNGAFEPEEAAKISVFDRGFLFGDAVYEVTAVLDGRLVDFEGHLARLDRSLGEIHIPRPMPDEGLRELHETLIAENGVDQGIVYVEISRGSAERDFAYPASPSPTVVAFTQTRPLVSHPQAETGVAVITIPDIRWKRRDIKSTSMLAQVMGKQEAKARNAYEAWMVEDGAVTEGTSSSAFIVDANGVLRTQPLGPQILHGVTRRAILRLAQENDVTIEERPFTVEDACNAQEAFLTAASAFVLPVVTIDGNAIGTGKPGPIASVFRKHYIDEARASFT